MMNTSKEVQERLRVAKQSVLKALISIAVMSAVIIPLSFIPILETSALTLGSLLLDYRGLSEKGLIGLAGSFPFTIQNLMWIVFFVGLGELNYRKKRALLEHQELKKSYLPEDDSTILQLDDIGEYYSRVRQTGKEGLFLPRLIQRACLQFQSSHSVDQANTLLNSSLELYHHEVDLRYTMLRYITWLIPTLGFIGTVLGIGAALGQAAGDAVDIKQVMDIIGVAFDTTLLALIQSAILVFIMNLIQSDEESALNASGQYCMDNLINRLYVPAHR